MGAGVDVAIIGAGQAGLSTSWHLTRLGIEHLVIERGRIGESWRTKRWDSFCLVTPNWSTLLPGAEYDGDAPDGFMPRNAFVRYLEDWVARFSPPVRSGVSLDRLETNGDGRWRLATSA